TEDLDDIIRVAASFQKTDKGEELDNLIRMNKSLNRNQGLDGLFRANLKAQQIDKRAQSLESLIYMNTQMDRDGKGNQAFGSLKKINQRTNREKGQDLSPQQIDATADGSSRRGRDLDNAMKINPKGHENISRGQSLDNFIKAVPSRANQGYQHGLDELINPSPKAVKTTSGHQDLDKFIKVNPDVLENNQRNNDLDGIIRNPTMIRHNQSQDLDNLIKVKPSALRNTNRDQSLEDLTEVDSHISENKNGRLDGQVNGFTNTLLKESPRTSVYSYEARNSLSSSTGTRNAGPKDTVIYTRTYVENSKSPKDGYHENISGKYIQTVYSTSDRSVIERDMCTYCRKPLGVETKMILDELQICCHSTCFKCEICKKPLENLQAGDSIWIYRQTIHCEPCYSKVIVDTNEKTLCIIINLAIIHLNGNSVEITTGRMSLDCLKSSLHMFKKMYYRATLLKTAWYWHKNRHVDQWNRIEDPDINPHRYENLIFDKDAKTVKWKKESIFNKWCWHNWMATCRRLQIDPYLSPCTKLKSKWIKDLNINPVTLNLIEENVGSTLERIGTGDHFLNKTPIAQTLSRTINQWDHMKLRSFCRAKDTITKTKRQPTEWEKIFTNPTSDRRLISRIYKELKKHDIKTHDSLIEKNAL
ncbi:hypothetical protein STEG23_023700, partial [Scotinomys teguina]